MVTTARLTDLEIETRIVPTALRWPNTTIAWERLKECVDQLRALVRAVDNECVNAETNSDFSLEGVQRRRTEIGRKALTELLNFRPFQLAEKAVTDNLALLERKMGTCRRPQRTSRTSCWQWKFGRTLVIRKAPSTSP